MTPELIAALVGSLTGAAGLITAVSTARLSAKKTELDVLRQTIDELQEENRRLRVIVSELQEENQQLRKKLGMTIRTPAKRLATRDDTD